jgi:hypothetical protein
MLRGDKKESYNCSIKTRQHQKMGLLYDVVIIRKFLVVTTIQSLPFLLGVGSLGV